jgi:hypothetical protein
MPAIQSGGRLCSNAEEEVFSADKQAIVKAQPESSCPNQLFIAMDDAWLQDTMKVRRACRVHPPE